MSQLSIVKIAESIRSAQKELAKTKFSPEAVERLDGILANTQTPLLIMVMGEFSTGKSTFINALVGKQVTVVDDLPTTAVITMLRYGDSEHIIVHWLDGSATEYDAEDFGRLTAEADEESNAQHEKIDYVERTLPLEVLKAITIIDSPGLNALKDAHTEATRRFVKEADTVLWLVSADKAASGTEYRGIEKLEPRLKPIVIVNKMDLLDEEEDDSEIFLEDIRQKLKDKAQTVIGLSAFDAFQGRTTGNINLFESSNFGAFEEAVVEIILPNRDAYKANSLVDSLSVWLSNLMVAVKDAEAENKEKEKTDYQAYVKQKQLFSDVEDAAAMIAAPLKDYCQESTNNASALLFLGVLCDYGLVLAEDDEKSMAYYEKAAVKHNTLAQVLLSMRHLEQDAPDKAAYWLEEAAQTDNRQAKVMLGRLYYNGQGVSKDYAKARELFEAAGTSKNADDYCNLGFIYLMGDGAEIDKPRAASCFQTASDMGDTTAQYMLGTMLLNGDGITQNIDDALRLLRQAAERGDSNAQLDVGTELLYGEHTSKDESQGIMWLEKAAAQGEVDALNHLGLYYRGKDDAKAREYYSQSAEKKNASGMYCLAMMFLYGIGGLANPERALEFLQDAADQDLADAQGTLAKIYDEGRFVEKDNDAAIYWARKAAKEQDEDGQYVLAKHLVEGDGITSDVSNGLNNLTHLAENSYLDAQELLAIYYQQGKYFPADQDKAMYWLQKADAQGGPFANYRLGMMYYEGDGVAQNTQEAVRRLERAATDGFTAAKREVAFMRMNGQGLPQDQAMAVRLYSDAAEAGDVESQFELGYALENGISVQKDIAKAKEWYQKAAEAGHIVAQNNLALLVDDIQTAIYWQEQAAKQDDGTLTQTNLASLYLRRGTEQDYINARNICVKLESEQRGSDESKEILGDIYYYGAGTNKDLESAQYWYKQIQNQEDNIKLRLAAILAQSANPDNQKRGTIELEIIARAGNLEAQYSLGEIFSSSSDVQIQTKGKYYLELAAKEGHRGAQQLIQQLIEKEKHKKKEIERATIKNVLLLIPAMLCMLFGTNRQTENVLLSLLGMVLFVFCFVNIFRVLNGMNEIDISKIIENFNIGKNN